MNIVALPYFPYISYKYVESDSGPIILYLEDSLNTRMLNTLAHHLNFTYELRYPSDGKFGTPAGGGNWTGIVGTLQYEMADFSMDLTVTPGRAEVVEYSTIFIDEPLVILSSKPKPLPEYLSVVRPLEDPCRHVVTRVSNSIDRLQRFSHLSPGGGEQIIRHKQHGGAGGARTDTRLGLGRPGNSNDRRI
ncbi:Glutamate receptor ionotropic, delta-2 [Portunus trituberculatus]|uniref:Glutamate receptor ionotropic, delta-2 n=1 Tax=Portunus trituberculatus TaxID=210409 RepID=A0A5B7G4V0_PORTR|nr:Glutamate receptor ionotropic, delta-2 [Portunus trituberculatus]